MNTLKVACYKCHHCNCMSFLGWKFLLDKNFTNANANAISSMQSRHTKKLAWQNFHQWKQVAKFSPSENFYVYIYDDSPCHPSGHKRCTLAQVQKAHDSSELGLCAQTRVAIERCTIRQMEQSAVRFEWEWIDLDHQLIPDKACQRWILHCGGCYWKHRSCEGESKSRCLLCRPEARSVLCHNIITTVW